MQYADLGDLKENDRIEQIGEYVMHRRAADGSPAIIGFFVEDDAKADRYIKKLQDKFPGIRVIDRVKQVIEKVSFTFVRVGAPLQ